MVEKPRMEKDDRRLVRRVRTARSKDGPHPGLLLLHGRGADENDLFSYADALDPRLVVVSPRAPLACMGGYQWFELQAQRREATESMIHSLALLDGLLDEMIGEFGVDARRMYAMGFSQGAVMTGGVLLTAPERLAGAVLLSGYVPIDAGLSIHPAGVTDTPIFVGHGTQDTVVSISLGRATQEYLQRAGANLTYREYAMGHGINMREWNDVTAWLAGQLDG